MTFPPDNMPLPITDSERLDRAMLDSHAPEDRVRGRIVVTLLVSFYPTRDKTLLPVRRRGLISLPGERDGEIQTEREKRGRAGERKHKVARLHSEINKSPSRPLCQGHSTVEQTNKTMTYHTERHRTPYHSLTGPSDRSKRSPLHRTPKT